MSDTYRVFTMLKTLVMVRAMSRQYVIIELSSSAS